MTGLPGRMRWRDADAPASVTALELFFDVVVSFAISQLSAFMAVEVSWHGVLRGLLVLGLLWWSWVCYAWLGNVVKADEGVARVGMFGAMAAMFVLALTIPEAFDDASGGLSGPVVIAVCYFVFRAIHLALFWIISRDDAGLRGQVWRFSPSMVTATVLLLVAAGVDGWAQTALWGAAVVADYLGNFLGGARGWRLRSVEHFAERHGLILIIALGESLLSIGVGVEGLGMAWPIVFAAVLGLALAATMWWAYFDRTAGRVEHSVAAVAATDRPRVGRNAYSYLHLPLIAGIVLVALGLKKVLEYAGGHEHDLTDALSGVALVALVAGVALYVLGNVGFELCATGRLNTYRIVAVLALLGVLGVGSWLPALATLGLLAAVMIVLIAAETAPTPASAVPG